MGLGKEVHIRQLSAIQGRKIAAITRIVEKHRHVCLESLEYDRNQPDVGLSQIESEAFPPGLPSDYLDKGGQSSKSTFH